MPICRRILDTSTGTAYYLTAAVRKEADDDVLDLKITDLQNSWSVTGHRRPAEGLTREHWMSFAREALLGETVEGAPRGERLLQWHITPGQPYPDTLTVLWVFLADVGTGQRRWKAGVTAHRAVDPRPIADPMVHDLLTELLSAQAMCTCLEGSGQGLASELSLAQTTLEQRLAVREAAEEQLYVKFAALLNEGKATAAEYRDRALAAEERLERLSLQGGFASASEGSGNDTAAAGSDTEDEATSSISISNDASRRPSQTASGAAAEPPMGQESSPSQPAKSAAAEMGHRQTVLDEVEDVGRWSTHRCGAAYWSLREQVVVERRLSKGWLPNGRSGLHVAPVGLLTSEIFRSCDVAAFTAGMHAKWVI